MERAGDDFGGRVRGRRRVYEGAKFDFEVVEVAATGRRAAADGVETVEREMVRHPGAVCVLPLLGGAAGGGVGPGVVLIRNHRFTVDEVLWEIPAGGLEAGESAGACAVRELEEEAGYSAGRVEELGSFLTTPGITDERMHAFVAWDLERVGQRLEVDEAIEVEVVSASDALAMATDGRMVDGKSMLTVLWAARAGYLDGSSAGGS